MKTTNLILGLAVAAMLSVNAMANENLTLTNNSTRRVANVTLQVTGTMTNVPSLEYQLGAGEWQDVVFGEKVSLAFAESISFRAKGENITFSESLDAYVNFVLKGDSIVASGNVMSLLDATRTRTDVPAYAFINLFKSCRALITAPEVPATQLSDFCYFAMFSDCGKLVEAPVLPALEMKNACYCSMFMSCVSLQVAPELPATVLADNCYNSMFFSCAKLTIAPELPAMELAEACYSTMFADCPKLTVSPDLNATKIANECYRMMFNGCANLRDIPAELPATKLGVESYYMMFAGCDQVTEAPVIRAIELEKDAMTGMFKRSANMSRVEVNFNEIVSGQASNMLQDVAPMGTFVCPRGLDQMELRSMCNIPNGWVIEEVDAVNDINGNDGQQIATGVEDVKANSTVGKVVRNGQVLIESEAGTFAMNGARL